MSYLLTCLPSQRRQDAALTTFVFLFQSTRVSLINPQSFPWKSVQWLHSCCIICKSLIYETSCHSCVETLNLLISFIWPSDISPTNPSVTKVCFKWDHSSATNAASLSMSHQGTQPFQLSPYSFTFIPVLFHIYLMTYLKKLEKLINEKKACQINIKTLCGKIRLLHR